MTDRSQDGMSSLALFFQQLAEKSAVTRRPDLLPNTAYTSDRCEADVVNLPSAREQPLQLEIRDLKQQLNEMEGRVAAAEREASESSHKIGSLKTELMDIKARVRELKANEPLSQQELEDKVAASQQEKLLKYEESAKKWDDEKAALTEQLKDAKRNSAIIERQLYGFKDALARTLQLLNNVENDRNNIPRELAEQKLTVEKERENRAVAVGCPNDVRKNAALQEEVRQRTEQLKRLEERYDEDMVELGKICIAAIDKLESSLDREVSKMRDDLKQKEEQLTEARENIRKRRAEVDLLRGSAVKGKGCSNSFIKKKRLFSESHLSSSSS